MCPELHIVFKDRWAVRQNDLLQALNETNPAVAHFSGHGSPDESFIIEDLAGRALAVSKDAIAAVIETATEGGASGGFQRLLLRRTG